MGKKDLYGKMFRCEPGIHHRLSRWDPDDTAGLNRDKAEEQFDKILTRLNELEFLLYAESKHSVLVVLQAMDAGGKDGTIRNVFGPLNPQSCKVASFKTPTALELSHDFLWRVHSVTPRLGEIAVFNRSHYEDVLIARVKSLVPRTVWSRRYSQINDFERLLAENGTHILKFFLHISKDEQLKRLKKRLDDPTRHWKMNPADFKERKLWGDYQNAYEDVFSRCSTDYAPWYVIPANHKWFRNLAIAQILAEKLESLKMKFPAPNYDVSKIKVK
ncbi:MAG: polyphosphate kinase 2 family protein [Sedimentisphaerales bacterium]|nr:polyphosphate kinase 2 family protein [Sedimentisphaerales bacterium]